MEKDTFKCILRYIIKDMTEEYEIIIKEAIRYGGGLAILIAIIFFLKELGGLIKNRNGYVKDLESIKKKIDNDYFHEISDLKEDIRDLRNDVQDLQQRVSKLEVSVRINRKNISNS